MMSSSLSAGAAWLVLKLVAPVEPTDAETAEAAVAEAVSPPSWARAFDTASLPSKVPQGGDVVVVRVGGHRDLATAARVLTAALSREADRSASQAEPVQSLPAGADAMALSEGGTLVAIQVFDGQSGQTRAVISVFDNGGALLDTFNVVAGGEPEPEATAAPPIATEDAAPPPPVDSPPEVAPATEKELHIVTHMPGSDAEATLYQVTMQFSGGGYTSGASVTISGEGFEQVCRLPCNEWIDTGRGGDFFVAGRKVPRSRSFTLPDRGKAIVDVDPGNKPRLYTGAALLGSGPVIAVMGAVVLGISTVGSRSKNGVIAGGVMIPVGLLMSGVAIPLLVRNRTSVSVR